VAVRRLQSLYIRRTFLFIQSLCSVYVNEVKSIEGEISLSLVMAGDNPEESSRPEKRRKQSVVKGLRQQVQDGNICGDGLLT